MAEKASTNEGKQTKIQPLPPAINFINGGLSGMCATCIVHPMDVLKNRMQMSEKSVSLVQMANTILKQEGFTKFYRGLSAGLVRQATYTTTRLGIYNQLLDAWSGTYGTRPNFLAVAGMSIIAGTTGAFVGTPAEVALIRMASDGRLPPDQRRNYKNVFDAFLRIGKEEGITTLWRGAIATMGRAAVVNVSQLATYNQCKRTFVEQFNIKEGILLQFYASMVSGFITTFNSLPFDIAKTRIQNMKTSGKAPGMISTIIAIMTSEGVAALWKGFWPTYCRIGPHTVFTFIFNEQFAKFYRSHMMG